MKVGNSKRNVGERGLKFVVPTRFAKVSNETPFLVTSIRTYLDNPKLHPLVKPFFRVGDYMAGVEYAFKRLPVREFYEIKPGVHYPGIPKNMKPVPCEYARVLLITPESDGEGTGDLGFGPILTSDRNLYLAVLTRAIDLLTPFGEIRNVTSH